MAKWGNEDLSKLDLHIIIERLRGIYRNHEGPVTYQSSRIELEAARRLELCLNLFTGNKINADLVLEMAKAAYEAACEDIGDKVGPLPAWDDASYVSRIVRESWVTGVGAGVGKFLSSLAEGGVAHGIMGKQNREGPSHEKESEATGEMPVQPLTGL